MRPVVIVEPLPGRELLLEIHVVAIGEQLIELVLIGSVRSLDLAVQLRCARLDVDVFHAQVCHVPVKERLELVTAVSSDGAYPERELLHDVVDEIDGIGLRVTAVDLQRPNSRGITSRSWMSYAAASLAEAPKPPLI